MAFWFLTNHPIPVPLYIHNNNCRFCNWVSYFIWVWNWAVKSTTGFTHIVKLLYSNQTHPFKIHMHFSAVWLRASLEKIKIKQSERDKTATKTNKKISIFLPPISIGQCSVSPIIERVRSWGVGPINWTILGNS